MEPTRPYSYQLIDEDFTGYAYYRLRQIDYNGKAAYSPIIFLEAGVAEKWQIFPNPSRGDVSLRLNQVKAGVNYGLKLTDVQGRTLIQLQAAPAAMEAELNRKLNGLPAGMYILTTLRRRQAAYYKAYS